MRRKARNCWEYTKCGREPGGSHTAELGICPAAVAEKFDGVNGGKYAGRFCWVVVGTLCGSEVQGTFAKKLRNCLRCSFLHLVEKEEGGHLVFTEDAMQSHSLAPCPTEMIGHFQTGTGPEPSR